MKRVLVYAVCDYFSLPNGGEVMLLNNFLSANKSEMIEYYLVGMSFNESDKVGKWSDKKIGNLVYKFLPVSQVLADKEKTHVPFRLRMVYGIRKYWKKIEKINADYHYIHSAELAIPFWRKNIRCVYHVHGDPCQTLRISRFPIFRIQLFTDCYWKIISRTIEKSNRVIWAADRSKELYLEQQPKMKEIVNKKSITIHSSFDTKLVVDEDSIPILSNRKHLVTVGRISRVKRMDFLVDVAYKLIEEGFDIDILICGDGEEKDALEEKAKYLGISDRVVFLGLLNRVQIATVLKYSDVFVFASENEAMSLVVLESLYMGVPVVSTDVGDISYVIKDGKTGYIVDGYDAKQYANKIKSIIKNGKIGYEDCCKRMAMNFTPCKMAEQINEVFNENSN
ncbi:glycosyltransferase family 1 protein [Clostridium sp. OM05-6BH]|jgi:glycosyltransferase involved in cell wall biosynthesis|uniref:glycosyltransferase family 4 protein n=1 Tax=unclassified Clostridium TaxID=2614128 RepID=UPI000E4E0C67|nr:MULTISPECIES: glycosyltransferase family 4 protein [unclassified Clostridium]RHV11318.1 glycosyltransferase family 1 protein [Clostridium sp. OM05-9BH]RHV17290.1 glycosyltransferase family 1 protein [Clostridium sp. OM05-6BH]